MDVGRRLPLGVTNSCLTQSCPDVVLAATLPQARGWTRDPRCWDATTHLLPFIFTLEDKKQTHAQLLRAGKLITPLQGDFCIHRPREISSE